MAGHYLCYLMPTCRFVFISILIEIQMNYSNCFAPTLTFLNTNVTRSLENIDRPYLQAFYQSKEQWLTS